jgi:hypothetical protein
MDGTIPRAGLLLDGRYPTGNEVLGKASRTSQVGYCSATSMAHEAEPNPHSRTLLSWGIAGKINLFSNILLKTSCIVRRRSASSYHMSNKDREPSTVVGGLGGHLPRRQERNRRYFRGHSADTLGRGAQPSRHTCCRAEWSGVRYRRLSIPRYT